MSSNVTFIDVVRDHAHNRADAVAVTFVHGGKQLPEPLTYGELDRRARDLAHALSEHGINPGDRVLVLHPAGPEYVVALLGCFYVGALAVPTYPPNTRKLARASERIRGIVEDAGAAAALGRAEHLESLAAEASMGSCRMLAGDATHGDPDAWRRPDIDAHAGCVLQYTSGSTSLPKGVLLTHGNLLANQRQIHGAIDTRPDDTLMSWLPPFHDMGLIGGILAPLYCGHHGVHMAPEAFLRRPVRWFEAVRDYRATVLLSPNFAFDLCVRRIPRAQREGLDLSRVRVCLTGAEPIDPDTLDRFCEEFAPYGFKRRALFPAYGLAESTLFVSGGCPDREARILGCDREALAVGRAQAAADAANSARLVSCGPLAEGTVVRIVDPVGGQALSEGRVGEIRVQGPAVAQGYFRNPSATRTTFVDTGTATGASRELRTGDLGFMLDGELYVTGRKKEVVIVRGHNYYPHDIERAAQAISPALARDSGAAFGVRGPTGEQLVVVQELDTRTTELREPAALAAAIAEAIQEVHGVAAHEVILIKRGTLLKTSSGKVQRNAMRDAHQRGSLTVVTRWQRPRSVAPPAEQSPSSRRPATILPPAPTGAEDRSGATTTAKPGDAQSVARFLVGALADKLGISSDEIDPRVSMARYGADSIVLAELADDLERWLGRPLPTTFTYDNPSIAQLAGAIAALRSSQAPTVPLRPQPRRSPRPEVSKGKGIAIIGIGCRFPGAATPHAYWELLAHEVDAIGETPPERWSAHDLYDPEPRTRGKICTRDGGYVSGIERFDPAFFGISQHEAERMDPQQRIFLEVAWEALEHAAIDPSALAGTETGVFVGAATSDYAVLYGGDLDLIDADYGTGNSSAIIANRLSYLLNLNGPSMTLDAACASSLVAIDAACQALARGDCELAIVGGVNALLAPEASVFLSQAGMLSPRGRCRAFNRDADGFVRGEGCGVLILKREADAEADSDRVLAMIEGSAVNHDGQSAGLLAPNGRSQRRVIERAAQRAGIVPSELDYVEAHGVGAPASDTVELATLAGLMESRPSERPCFVGSAKTNIGHLEAASGMASILKVVLALQHACIPAHLHLQDPHPLLTDTEGRLSVPTRAKAWPSGAGRRRAGVSAFGFGGTNAHVVLAEAPTAHRPHRRATREVQLAMLSAHSERALTDLAMRLARHIASAQRAPSENLSLGDLCHTLATGRAHFRHRVAVVVTDPLELCDQLEAFATAARLQPQGLRWSGSPALGGLPGVALVFGDRPVEWNAVRSLAAIHPTAGTALERTARCAAEYGETGLLDVLRGKRATADVRGRVDSAVLTLAVHRALHGLMQESGIQATALLGSGEGEYSAACAAGVFAWDAILPLSIKRAQVLAGFEPGAEVHCTRRQFAQAASGLVPKPPTVPLVLGSLGRELSGDGTLDPGWLTGQLLHEPRPGEGEQALLSTGATVRLTLGDAPLPSSATSVTAPPGDGGHLALLARGDDAAADLWISVMSALAALYVRGIMPNLTGLDSPFGYRRCELPTYPFDRQRYWLAFPGRTLAREVKTTSVPAIAHPMLRSVRTVTRTRSGFAPAHSSKGDRRGRAGTDA